MNFKVFLIRHRLSEAAEKELHETRQNPQDGVTPVIRYTRKRGIKEMEFDSKDEVLDWASKQAVEVPDHPTVYREYVTVFGACEARDGECCSRLENAFEAEQLDLGL